MTFLRITAVGALSLAVLLLVPIVPTASAAKVRLSPAQRTAFALMPHSSSFDIPSSGEVTVASDRHMRIAATRTDPFYADQWYLSNAGQGDGGTVGRPGVDVNAEAAWDLADGSGQTIAVVDTGVQSDQPDLAGSLWVDPGEIAGNGTDDDADGFVDDVNGWSFADNSPDFTDVEGHGTVVAGEIAAQADNGFGIAGLAYGAKVMPLQVGKTEDINVLYASEAFEYAAQHGAVAANASFGGPAAFDGLEAAIAKAPQTLYVVAAGNTGTDVDRYPFYPCSYKELNIICVAATDDQDRLASFSNYGGISVDLAAPGTTITSDFTASRLANGDGTSMAAPLVTATVALVKQRFPDYDALQIRQKIIHSAEKVPGLEGKVATSGRLDAAAALATSDGNFPNTKFPHQPHVFTGKSAKVRIHLTQPGAIEECKLQGAGRWVGCSTGRAIQITTGMLKPGRYRLVARAIGADGDAERRPATFHFQVKRRRAGR